MDMGLSMKGPIGWDHMNDFCIAAAFQLPPASQAKPNKVLITCKICGLQVEGGEAKEVFIVGQCKSDYLNMSKYFLCDECYKIVRDATEKDKKFRESTQ